MKASRTITTVDDLRSDAAEAETAFLAAKAERDRAFDRLLTEMADGESVLINNRRHRAGIITRYSGFNPDRAIEVLADTDATTGSGQWIRTTAVKSGLLVASKSTTAAAIHGVNLADLYDNARVGERSLVKAADASNGARSTTKWADPFLIVDSRPALAVAS